MSHALIDQALASFFDLEAVVDEEDGDEEMGNEASQELSECKFSIHWNTEPSSNNNKNR